MVYQLTQKNIALVYQFTPGYDRLKELQIGLTLIEKQLPQNKTLKKIKKTTYTFYALSEQKLIKRRYRFNGMGKSVK